MKRWKCLWLTLCLCCGICGCAKENAPKETEQVKKELSRMEAWQAGEAVSEAAIERYGYERCFVAEPISDTLFARMYGKSYKTDCTIPREELRYLKVLHKDAEGVIRLGELVSHASVSKDLLAIFRELYAAAYPIERMQLIDDYEADDERSMLANNSSAFNFRLIAGTTKLSNHSKGLAVDINPLYNPYVKVRADGSLYISPEAGAAYADRSQSFTYKIEPDDLCCRLFKQYGFEWGGGWTSLKDYQHFEKGE